MTYTPVLWVETCPPVSPNQKDPSRTYAMPASWKSELLFDARAQLGEGPLWDTEADGLWWIDIKGHKVHFYSRVDKTNAAYNVGQPIGTVVKRARGGLVLAVRDGFAFYDPATEVLAPICNPEADKPTNRLNDGKCDPAGRFWAGSMDDKEEDMSAGALFCLNADGTAVEKVSGVGISNGIVWTADKKTMYYIDSPTRRVDAFDFDNDTGEIANRHEAFAIPDSLGHKGAVAYPDGMAIDDEDKLWVALWGGGGVARFDPASGEVLGKVEVDASHVTACAFGGPNRDELYITTAKHGLSPERAAEEPHAGSLFIATPGVSGPAFPSFIG